MNKLITRIKFITSNNKRQMCKVHELLRKLSSLFYPSTFTVIHHPIGRLPIGNFVSLVEALLGLHRNTDTNTRSVRY